MNYTLFILRGAQKELSTLPLDIYPRVKQAIFALSMNPRPTRCRKLTGRNGWRIKVGNYRVIYEFDDKKKSVLILHIGHRRDVYR
ncbi:MAG: type II toxin-antitoxin system RelE/ParE family toxin [bacterium]|nr:type II toxin-antitoxin system RelE/ParE family toxin [bacterium]